MSLLPWPGPEKGKMEGRCGLGVTAGGGFASGGSAYPGRAGPQVELPGTGTRVPFSESSVVLE